MFTEAKKELVGKSSSYALKISKMPNIKQIIEHSLNNN